MRPRPYLSFSQMTKYEMSPGQFVEEYLYGKRQRVSRNMAYGSKMAEALEAEEASGDPFLDLMMARLPKFQIMDRPIQDPRGVEVEFGRNGKAEIVRIPVLENGGDDIPLMAVPDTAAIGYYAFKEYKTSVRKWTQRMADESGQITFYVTAIWITTGVVPQDVELVNVPVEYQPDGRLQPTGEIVRIPTKRTMADVIKMTARIRKAWKGIKELCESELL